MTNLSFKMFKRMRFLRSWKCSKTTVESTYTTQKGKVCSSWTDFSVFDWKYPFWLNLVLKLKIVGLTKNLVLRLIQICRVPWQCSLFLFFDRKYHFGQIWSKIQNCQFEQKFESRLIWNFRIQWWCSLFRF